MLQVQDKLLSFAVRYSEYYSFGAELRISRKSVLLLLQTHLLSPAPSLVISRPKKNASNQRSEFILQSFSSYDMCHINTVWVVNFLCILIHTSAIQYTHDWAIEVDGGHEEADLLAKDTGCVNQGKTIIIFFLWGTCFVYF